MPLYFEVIMLGKSDNHNQIFGMATSSQSQV